MDGCYKKTEAAMAENPDHHPSQAESPPGPPSPPAIPEYALIRLIGRGSYGEVWLARNAFGTYRALKIVHEKSFRNRRPFEREFKGVQKFEPISRLHDGLVDVLHVGHNDAAG